MDELYRDQVKEYHGHTLTDNKQIHILENNVIKNHL